MNSGLQQMLNNSVFYSFDELVPFYSTSFEEIILKPKDINIKPKDIDTSIHFQGAFGAFENEKAAANIVEFCAQRDNTWKKFTYQEINDYFRDKAKKESQQAYFSFFGLILGEFIAIDDIGNYYPTKTFVTRCFDSVEKTKRGEKTTNHPRWILR